MIFHVDTKNTEYHEKINFIPEAFYKVFLFDFFGASVVFYFISNPVHDQRHKSFTFVQ